MTGIYNPQNYPIVNGQPWFPEAGPPPTVVNNANLWNPFGNKSSSIWLWVAGAFILLMMFRGRH